MIRVEEYMGGWVAFGYRFPSGICDSIYASPIDPWFAAWKCAERLRSKLGR